MDPSSVCGVLARMEIEDAVEEEEELEEGGKLLMLLPPEDERARSEAKDAELMTVCGNVDSNSVRSNARSGDDLLRGSFAWTCIAV